jgi:hypothetical protein
VSVIIDTLKNVAEFMGIDPGDYMEYPFYSHRFCANLEKTPEHYEWEIRHRYDFLGRMAVRSLQIRYRLKNSNAPLQMFYGSQYSLDKIEYYQCYNAWKETHPDHTLTPVKSTSMSKVLLKEKRFVFSESSRPSENPKKQKTMNFSK